MPPPDLPIIPVSKEVLEITHAFIGVASTLVFIALVTLIRRIYVKAKQNWSFGLDDYCIFLGFVCAFFFFSISVECMGSWTMTCFFLIA